jgi:DNA-binding transcriptional MerR regulator/effector-binding domain-containing protein
MFKIGEFSRIGRVSMRLLRYYDEIGLLRPAHTDSSNGYRFYTAAQLPELNRILVLRDLGLSFEQIARALHKGVSPDELRGMLMMRRAEIEQLQVEQALQLRQLESRIAALDSAAQDTPDDVIIRAEPERRYLSLRARHPSFLSAVQMVLEMHREIPRQVGRGVIGAFLGVSHSSEFEPDDIDLELGFALEAEPQKLPQFAGQTLTLSTLPAHTRVATCVRVGSPIHAHLTTGRIARHLEATGYRIAGPSREIFLEPPRDGQMDHAVVEMAFPVEPQEG